MAGLVLKWGAVLAVATSALARQSVLDPFRRDERDRCSGKVF